MINDEALDSLRKRLQLYPSTLGSVVNSASDSDDNSLRAESPNDSLIPMQQSQQTFEVDMLNGSTSPHRNIPILLEESDNQTTHLLEIDSSDQIADQVTSENEREGYLRVSLYDARDSDDDTSINTNSEFYSRGRNQLTALDLSWCGPYKAITLHTFLEFILKCGENLTILRLSCCDFLDNYALYVLANVCRELTGK